MSIQTTSVKFFSVAIAVLSILISAKSYSYTSEDVFQVEKYNRTPAQIAKAITSYYHSVLERQPDPGGLQHWINQHDRGMSLLEIHARIAASEEARARINLYYQCILWRPVDPGGMATWVNYMGGMTAGMASVSYHLFNSPEAKMLRAQGKHMRCVPNSGWNMQVLQGT